jgi:hypothetical protein
VPETRLNAWVFCNDLNLKLVSDVFSMLACATVSFDVAVVCRKECVFAGVTSRHLKNTGATCIYTPHMQEMWLLVSSNDKLLFAVAAAHVKQCSDYKAQGTETAATTTEARLLDLNSTVYRCHIMSSHSRPNHGTGLS